MEKVGFKAYVDKSGAEWVQMAGLQKKFSICRATVRKLLQEMRTLPKYSSSYLDLGYNLKLIKIKDFERFLHERSERKDYLRK